MNLWEYLDRRAERRTRRAPSDYRIGLGALFFIGYYGLVLALMARPLPGESAPLVRDAMLVLGPVIGLIAQSLFRSDKRDEIAATNTGEAFKAQRAQAEAVIATSQTGGTNA